MYVQGTTKSWTVLHVNVCVWLYYRLEMISTDKSSALSKATKANEHCKLLLTEKDLQLKKCQERYIQ